MRMFTINQQKIIKQTEYFAKNFMKYYDWSHDYNHILRVKNIATEIAIQEAFTTNDIFEVQLGALLHDINDNKYKIQNETQHGIIRRFYNDKTIDPTTVDNVVDIACNTSLSKELSESMPIVCKKIQCVRDADRLDSLGAIGISRYMKYGITKHDHNLEDIVANMETRTKLLETRITTKTGKEMMQKKIELIRLFIQDYYESI